MSEETRGKGFSLLIVDDEDGLRYGLERLFKKQGFRVYTASNEDEAKTIALRNAIDVALLDIRLRGGQSGMTLLKDLKQMEPDLIALMMTGYGSIETAVASMKEGASDYLLKPLDNTNLLDVVYTHLDLRSLKTRNLFLQDELLLQGLSHQCVTQNAQIKALLRQADKIKDNAVTALITGESGTGKEVIARYIHFTSNRRNGAFVCVNCAALSEHLLLSELFGHERGAFTGAMSRKIGKFEIANQGTLFLDEIGDMSLDIQAKLLRVIEEQSFERVGGTKRITSDARIIAATNKDLEQAIRDGRFREDLYYRIHVVRFHLPPLRERKEDIPLLITHFLGKYNQKYQTHVAGAEQDVLSALMAYDWPGNVRELEHVINNAVLLCENHLITMEDVKRNIFSKTADSVHHPEASRIASLKDAIDEIVARHEKQIIEETLCRNQQNKSKTARDLAITRKTLAEKMEKYRLNERNET
ncbi:two component, sigma54 specific, transcriptional regulator, Fis family [Candidatus Moduliflexus flocculans]|uniref:Two component, sigma54 specific, transcriptional regulator, Fis family n=1 Tax=Candidatus Moduliflexus flocculans TaxID=1499966 RepID=A0A081BNL9_9BACT|nr:two component, sigma54 specific, transcriptional regulator, Fis family [Candidatus Moduliflexus flocculans]